jgi:hypothetical protein
MLCCRSMYILRPLLHIVHMDRIHYTDKVSFNNSKMQIRTYSFFL